MFNLIHEEVGRKNLSFRDELELEWAANPTTFIRHLTRRDASNSKRTTLFFPGFLDARSKNKLIETTWLAYPTDNATFFSSEAVFFASSVKINKKLRPRKRPRRKFGHVRKRKKKFRVANLIVFNDFRGCFFTRSFAGSSSAIKHRFRFPLASSTLKARSFN